MKRLLATALGTSLLLSSGAGGCAFAEHRRYREADADYRECLEENPRSPETCEPLRAARDREYERYERTAERAWGCERTPEGCDPPPPPR